MTNFKIALLIFICSVRFLVQAQCDKNNQTFQSGEVGEYSIYYNWGFIWLHAAEVSFATKSITLNGKKALHFISKGSTLPNYDWILKVRDVYQSKVDSATLQPIWFSRVTQEGNYAVNNQYQFVDQKIYSSVENSEKPKTTDTINYTGCVYDLLTAIYATRTIPYHELQTQDTISLRVVIDGKIYNLSIRYLGLEVIKNRDQQVFRCRKISVELVSGTIFTGGDEMVVWVSDDKAKVPIRVEAKILVGSIVANLDQVSGNRWPLLSRIEPKTTVKEPDR